MRKLYHRLCLGCMGFGLLMTLSAPVFAASGTIESTLEFGRFGKITLYVPPAEPDQVVLFISGDGGWNLGVVDMARELAGLDALVVGVDIRHYLKSLEAGQEKCAYPAGDFEALGQFVQKKLGYRQFHRPVLVGYLLRRGQPGFLPRSDAAQIPMQGKRPQPQDRPETGPDIRSRSPSC
jgi:type IV secretory pathway VirJ component